MRGALERFISMDVCSEGLNRLRNSGLVLKKIYTFLRQDLSSKFLDFFPFVYVVKMRKKKKKKKGQHAFS